MNANAKELNEQLSWTNEIEVQMESTEDSVIWTFKSVKEAVRTAKKLNESKIFVWNKRAIGGRWIALDI